MDPKGCEKEALATLSEQEQALLTRFKAALKEGVDDMKAGRETGEFPKDMTDQAISEAVIRTLEVNDPRYSDVLDKMEKPYNTCVLNNQMLNAMREAEPPARSR